jgi:alpha-2-macroglobulin
VKTLWIAGLAGLFVLAPFSAQSDSSPQVSFAIPGTGGTNASAINRFTLGFSEAMVPVGDPRAQPPAAMKCQTPSNGRWVDAQTYVFEFEQPLPGGITCAVDLKDGLKSARGVTLSGTRQFMIDTGGPTIRAILPGEDNEDIEEDQVFLVATNTIAAPASVRGGGYCTIDGVGERINLDVLGNEVAIKLLAELSDDNWESRSFLESAGLPQLLSADAKERSKAMATVLAVKCQRPLPPGHNMSVVWTAGIATADGRKTGRDQRFDFNTRKAFAARFECRRMNPQAGCSPIQAAHLRFTAPVPANIARSVRLTFADGGTFEPKLSKEDEGSAMLSDLAFKGPFPAGQTAKVSIPEGVKDESGRPLTNASRFPLTVAFDASPPLVKFAASFGILEAKEGGVLPVTVRAIEPQLEQRITSVSGTTLKVGDSDREIAAWLRKLAKADSNVFHEEHHGKDTMSVNDTGTKSILNGAGARLKLSPPGSGKAFEVIGIPLKEPGFYVVELASPKLGQALLGRPLNRYVSAGALVTNLSVHFKWGREKSLAWVTTLDGARPVVGADVRITDSCTGKPLAQGASDKQGRLSISGLPEPETNTGCGDNASHALMVSARSPGDFSFTLTDWGEGIRPYDFDLPYGWSESAEILHTIFDRTLVRQGETVNMKHILRRPIGSGFEFGKAVSGTLKLVHQGSDTEFSMPITIGDDGIGETSWTAPKGAPMGDYSLRVEVSKRIIETFQTLRVDEFRLPTMRATISGPKELLVRPAQVPLNLFVGYLSGGAASNLPVSVRTSFESYNASPDDWIGWTFGGRNIVEGTVPLDRSGDEDDIPLPQTQTVPITLGNDGTASTVLDINQKIDAETALHVEMDYLDANGETLTTAKTIPLLASAIRLGIQTDGWMMRDNDLRLKLVTLDTSNKPARGKVVSVDVYARETLTARRRLIGGFYAYDNQMRTRKIGAHCTATTDRLGLANCKLDPSVSGEVTVVASTVDNNGNTARAVRTVWLAGEDEWWFGGDNGDRMDVIPEAKSYKAGDTAKLQVRMPFREATALVTVEREGVISSFVTKLSGTDPVINVPMPDSYAPDIFVSVLAVRGRVGGFKLWTAKIARDWNLPFLSHDGYEPTALVDLAKPSYRIGIAKVKVGWEGHSLAVKVKADKMRYGVRDIANVDIAVDQPNGKPAKSAEVAFAAVDEALLQLAPNESWQLIDAMMGERPLSVLTSTAQTQVVGKRHFGKKAVEAGGGGGDDSAVTRSDFKPVLLWRGRVALDGQGKAKIPVQLADTLSSYKLVAIANAGEGLFGTGEATIRTAQDLTVYAGLPPLVRSGDWFAANFTLKNGTDKPMTITATVDVTPSVARGEPLTVTIPAGGSAPVTWNMTVPGNVASLNWTVEATSSNGKATDKVAVSQAVIPAVPIETWASTLVRVGEGSPLHLVAPAGALPGLGYVDVKLSSSLAPPLAGVRDYMAAYPYSCFEQQTSRFVALADPAGWDKFATEIPAYLDHDGLLRYWPVADLRGSIELTAYVLSITSEAGFSVPYDQRSKMIEALKSVVAGKLERDTAWSSDARMLRIASLAALARAGEATPAMFSQIDTAPADMATSSLADWIIAADRVPGFSSVARNEAEAVLRQRIVYEGSRVDLTDKGNAPWWMMSSADEMAIKAQLATLGRPGWAETDGRMMVGLALRQRRGHWDTTTANAWGSIAARRFAEHYPATAITGVTTVALGSDSKSVNWPLTSGAPPLRLSLPLVKTPLMLVQSGGAGPWASVSLAAAVSLKEPLFAGYRIEKSISAISQAHLGQWTRGDVVKIRITVNSTAGRNWVVINDPVPPGASVLGGLGGQSAQLAQKADGNDGVWPSYIERGNDSWRGFYEWVPEGKLVVEYAMRLNGVGRFSLPATRVEALYSPDIRGQLPNAPFAVAMR